MGKVTKRMDKVDTTYTVTQKPAPSEIVLKGTLPPKIEKHIELENREFAGTERDYKPIPTVPLFIPMIAFNENAPDLTGRLLRGDGLAHRRHRVRRGCHRQRGQSRR